MGGLGAESVVRLGPPKTLGRLTTNGRGVGKGRGTEDWIPAEDAGMTAGLPWRVGCWGVVVRHGLPGTTDRLTTNGWVPAD